MITQYAAAKVGAILVNINPPYRLRELEYALNQSGISVLVAARRIPEDRLRRDAHRADAGTRRRRGRAALDARAVPGLRHVVYLGTEGAPGGTAWTGLRARGERASATLICATRRSAAAVRRSRQHPVHVRDNRIAQGRDAVAPQHPEQRIFRRRGASLHRRRPHLCAGALLSLLRLRDGQSRRPHARISGGHSGRIVRCRSDAARHRQRTAARRSTACRRCSSRCSIIRRSAASTRRRCGPASWPAHRVPIEVMREVIDRMHVREVTICYGMTETSPVSFQSAVDDPIRRAGFDGRPRPPASRVQDRRPRHRRHRAARHGRRTVHAWLLGDARLLGQPRSHRQRHRPRALDAQRRPRHHARRWIREYLRTHQGHDHPRRREHLPARDRGIPLHAPEGAARCR